MGKKKVAGGAGKVSTSVETGDISHIRDSQIGVGENIFQINNINFIGVSEKQAREMFSSQLYPKLNEIVIESTKRTQEQQMTYEAIKEKVNEADQLFDEPLGNPDTYLKMGNIEYDRQNYEEAIDYFNKIIEIDIRNVSALFNKGFALNNLERYDEAIIFYDKIIEIDPEHVGAWYNKGIALHNLGRYGEANRCYDKALEMEPEHVGMWYSKGLILHNLGRYSEAIRCYDKVLEIDPNHKLVKRNREIAKRIIGKII